MTNIKPGPELDRAMAEAIGCPLNQGFSLYYCKNCHRRKIDRYTFNDGCFCDCERPPGGPIPRLELASGDFCPSTDLNAAFAAAEKVGLFEMHIAVDGCFLTLAQVTDRESRKKSWRLQKQPLGDHWDWYGDEQPTPALAICAAILKLKEMEVSEENH